MDLDRGCSDRSPNRGAIGTGYAYDWWSYDRHVALVVATARVDPEKCVEAGFPVYLEVFNGSTKTVESTSFSIIAKRPNRSTNVSDFRDTTDHIIKPGGRLTACANPTLKPEAKDEDPRKLEWSGGPVIVHSE